MTSEQFAGLKKGDRVRMDIRLASGHYTGEATVLRVEPPPHWLPGEQPFVTVGWPGHKVSVVAADLQEKLP